MKPTACPRCGIAGVHACPGGPVAWTPVQRHELDAVLSQIFPGLEDGKPDVIYVDLDGALVSDPQDKRARVQRHLGAHVPVNLVDGGLAKADLAHRRAVLIDDLPRNIQAWQAAGGKGLLLVRAKQTLADLTRLGVRDSGPAERASKL